MQEMPRNTKFQSHHHIHHGAMHHNTALNTECWAPWHDLTHCVVGTCVTEHYFDDVKDVKVRDPLCRMLRETQEDLDHIANTLINMGVTVIRPPVAA
jgi:hypothetical protein